MEPPPAPVPHAAGATERHEELFVSGAYADVFRPDSSWNPFAELYARKRALVCGSVEGRGKRILDIGGGAGRMAIPLSMRHTVVLCDLSRRMLEGAVEQTGDRLRVCVADARLLPFPDAHFDYAVCIDVLCHLHDPQIALREARRVLRTGGVLIADSSNSLPFWTLAYPRYLGRNPRRWLQTWRAGGVPPEWRSRVWHRRVGTLRRDLARSGFAIEHLHPLGPPLCPKWHVAIASAVPTGSPPRPAPCEPAVETPPQSCP